MKDYNKHGYRDEYERRNDPETGWEHFWSLTIGLGVIGFIIGDMGGGGFLQGLEVCAAFVAGPLATWVIFGWLFRMGP